MVSHRHTNGNGIYLPAASTSAMFSTTNSEISKKSARREFASAKVQIPLQLLTILQQIITFIKISVVVAYTIYRDGIGFA